MINNIVHYLLSFAALGTVSYLLILRPQRNYAHHSSTLSQELQLGATIWTTNGTAGTVLAIYQNTLVIQDQTGKKIEILKQTIKTIQP